MTKYDLAEGLGAKSNVVLVLRLEDVKAIFYKWVYKKSGALDQLDHLNIFNTYL